jgi:membrane fusion protein, copper/silver efflux system
MRDTTRTVWVLIATASLLATAGIMWTACGRSAQHTDHSTQAQRTQYHCPMHPTYVSDKPGNCPICGMTLVPTETAAPSATSTASPGQRKIAYYRSPMDPSVHSDRPAKDSMGMDFIAVYEDERAGASSTVAGRAVVALSPERRQLLGIRSEQVREQHIEHAIRTVGRVTADETRIHHIHTKYDAYVEHLYVDFTGKFVKKGDHLVALFSPELLATQEEYLLALRARDRLAASDQPGVAKGGADLLEATRQRLLLWDIAPEDIDAIARAGKPQRALDLHSDVSGYVLQKNAIQGMRVMQADTLFDIADLSHLWVLADVYVSDLSAIRLGMQAEVSAAYLPGQTWRGPVTYIAPTVDEKTRTVKVRVEVDNRDAALKPDMFADVLLKTDLGKGLVVPESAVIDAGDRKLVFLDRTDGSLEPRQVEIGAALSDGVQVLSGLAQGDRVVTSANFLLDSESSLKAALSSMATPSPAGKPEPPAGHQH